MSLEDNRLRKRIGTAAFLDMKAKEYVNNQQLQDSSDRITHMFDNLTKCREINELVLSNPLNNYYEYKITDLSGVISDSSKFYFPREFYLTGIQVINRNTEPTLNPFTLKLNNTQELLKSQTTQISPYYYIKNAVSKIRKIKQTDYLNFEGNPDIDSGTYLIFNGFM